MNTLVTVILALLVTNVLTLAGLVFLVVRHQGTIDMLTSKIMSPDLASYSVNKPEVIRAKTDRSNKVKNNPMVGIAEADPEDVMRALSVQAGRGEEMPY